MILTNPAKINWKKTLLAEPFPTTFLIYADWLEEQGVDPKVVAGWKRAAKYKPNYDNNKRWNWYNYPNVYRYRGIPTHIEHTKSNLPFKLFGAIAGHRGHSERTAKRLWLVGFKNEAQARRALVHVLLTVYPAP